MKQPIKVYVLARTPGATETVEWTDICHSRETFVAVSHEQFRDLSRWTHAARGRPFAVRVHRRPGSSIAMPEARWFGSLTSAMRAAFASARGLGS